METPTGHRTWDVACGHKNASTTAASVWRRPCRWVHPLKLLHRWEVLNTWQADICMVAQVAWVIWMGWMVESAPRVTCVGRCPTSLPSHKVLQGKQWQLQWHCILVMHAFLAIIGVLVVVNARPGIWELMTTGSGPSDGPVGEASAKGLHLSREVPAAGNSRAVLRCTELQITKKSQVGSLQWVEFSKHFHLISPDDFTTESWLILIDFPL